MLHQATVVDRMATDAQWRMKVTVPGLTGGSIELAYPMLLNSTAQKKPANKATVWVAETDAGNLVWLGEWATVGTNVDQLLVGDHDTYLTNEKHDITARHQFGAALGTPGAAAAIGTTASAGVGTGPARSDHVHILGAGSINLSTLFTAGIINTAALGNAQVTNVKLAADVTSQFSTLTGNLSSLSGTVSSQGSSISSNASAISSLGSTVSSNSSAISDLQNRQRVYTSSAVSTTDSGGVADFFYGHTFSGVPDPIVAIGDSNVDTVHLRRGNHTTSSFNARCKVWNGTALVPVASSSVRLNWVAAEP